MNQPLHQPSDHVDSSVTSNGEPGSLLARMNSFFFEEQVLYGSALARIFLPTMAMLPMLMRFPRARELYSTDGTPIQLFELYGHAPALPVLPAGIAIALYSLMIFAFLCGIIGWKTRWSLSIATSLYLYFNLLDAVGSITKYSVIASHLLLLLTISSCGTVWSIDAWIRRRNHQADDTTEEQLPVTAPMWPVRLMQMLFAFIYFGAAITKIQTESFFSGEQMRYWMLSNWNYNNPVGEVMSMWAPILLISAYATAVWEILFAVLVWNRRLRLPMLAVGAIFHIMTWLTLGLYIFPAICLSGYLCFVTPQDVRAVRNFFGNFGSLSSGFARRVPQLPSLMPSGVAWGVSACLFGLVAMEVEYRNDLYGMRREEGLYTLRELSPEEAQERLGDEKPLREKDKFFSFGLGDMTIGGQLAYRKEHFEYGDMIIAECNVNPPHEDMWVECILQDEEHRPVETMGKFVTREMLRESFWYRVGNRLTPGNYSMVLKSSGQEIHRCPFTVSGEPAAVAVTPNIYAN